MTPKEEAKTSREQNDHSKIRNNEIVQTHDRYTVKQTTSAEDSRILIYSKENDTTLRTASFTSFISKHVIEVSIDHKIAGLRVKTSKKAETTIKTFKRY